jgi:PKD repeat protein
MATPFVSGIAGLMLAVNPSLSPSALKSLIMQNVDKVPALNGKVNSGGRVNAQKAVSAAKGASITTVPTATTAPTTTAKTPTPTQPGVKPFPGYTTPPTDPNRDGLYEDTNGNGRADFNDVIVFFNNMEWVIANQPVAAFDFSKNGRIDFTDIVKLFESIV